MGAFLIPAALGAAKTGMGIADMIKGRKALKNAKDPGVVSEEEKRAVASAKQRALGGLPTDKLAMEAIERNKANTMSALTKGGSAKNMMAGMLASQGQAQQAQAQEIAQQGTRKVQMAEKADAMSAKLGAKRIADQQKKYQDTVASAKQDIQTGKKNIMTGLTDIGGAAISGMYGGDTGSDEEGINPNQQERRDRRQFRRWVKQ